MFVPSPELKCTIAHDADYHMDLNREIPLITQNNSEITIEGPLHEFQKKYIVSKDRFTTYEDQDMWWAEAAGLAEYCYRPLEVGDITEATVLGFNCKLLVVSHEITNPNQHHLECKYRFVPIQMAGVNHIPVGI